MVRIRKNGIKMLNALRQKIHPVYPAILLFSYFKNWGCGGYLCGLNFLTRVADASV
jgi:hypothetical protein